MSKKVTALTAAIYVAGHNLCRASDGSIRVVRPEAKRGENVESCDAALRPAGVKALKKALPLIKEIAVLQDKLRNAENKLSNLSSRDARLSDYDGVSFESDCGEVFVSVGCTNLEGGDLRDAIKKLGI